MHKRYVVAMLAVSIVAVGGLSVKNVSAISQNLVISQVQTRSLTSTSASDELVELYNNSDSDINITNWCLHYGESGTLMPTKTLSCFKASSEATDDKVMIKARSCILLVSKAFADSHPGFSYDAIFSNGLTDSDRWVSLRNNGTVVDAVEWSGNGILSITAEGAKTAPSPTSTQLIQRKVTTDGALKDSDNNFDDFERAPERLKYSPGSIYEVEDVCRNITGFQSVVPLDYTVDDDGNCQPPPVDVCKNLDGLQIVLPIGYEFDNGGLCQPDVCRNISGLQLTMPSGKELDSVGNCVDHDECSNLPYIQSAIPDGFMRAEDNSCILGLLPLRLTELLPNADGDDISHEYIEIYNPNDSRVDLLYYFFYVGSDNTHFYSFPVGTYIEPMQYRAFYNDDINFMLVNTTGSVRLRAIDNSFIDETPVYDNAGSGMAWALINNTWQYTNQPTPNAANVASFEVEEEEIEVEPELKPCAPNQYRNPETNRCKLIVLAGSTLVPCKDGQYRSEITNRCRSIASDATLQSCGPGQYRNPETNRCKSILGATSTLTPCAIGEERNPETNRCRKIGPSLVPSAPFAVEPIAVAQGNYIDTWVLGGVGLVAVAYGLWEWRVEFRNVFRKVVRVFRKDKA